MIFKEEMVGERNKATRYLPIGQRTNCSLDNYIAEHCISRAAGINGISIRAHRAAWVERSQLRCRGRAQVRQIERCKQPSGCSQRLSSVERR